ncbi:unnamed protein product [Cylindrotheca closterium]|uniref:Uncharacterized protein n=1 Tax=Cylindrotheca closterium TaxID=2856 RepID=A0AAD2FXB5_9STRA|nr:unnamed protein product [Cylindrotheca closterium]
MENPEKEEELTGGGTPSVQLYCSGPTMTRRRKALTAGKLPAQAPATMVQNRNASEEILAPNCSPVEVVKFLESRVATRLQGNEALSEHKAPPAMLALAQEIMEQVVNSKPTRLSESLQSKPKFSNTQ